MLKELTTAARAMLVLTLLLGVGYPLLITGVAQVVMPGRANGSLIAGGGSELLGVATLKGKAPDPAFFQPRPSATDYATDTSYFSNRGPNSDTARAFYRGQVRDYLALNAPTNPGLTAAGIPVDAVTTSGSGVDPGISPADAAIQARRVAAARGIDLATVTRLVREHTHGRFLGVFGERTVNVPELNLALRNLKAAA